MSAIDQLLTAGPNSVGRHTFLDADTLRDPDDPNKTYRIQGYDAPEIASWNQSGEQYKGATAGAGASLLIPNLAQSQGFHNVVKLTNEDGSPKFDATGSRQMVDLQNEKGQSFTTELLKSGALEAGKYTTQEDLTAIEVARHFREENYDQTEWGKAAATISGAIEEETTRDLEFKEAAVNEADYAAGRGSSNVKFRHSDRDLRNRSLNPLSDSWDQGWIGVKESAYGFLNLLGETSESEWLAEVGEAGVIRAGKQLQERGSLLVDYKDVDGFGSAVEYLGNNLALSLPYMIGIAGATTAGTLAAPVVGAAGAIGIGVGAPATIYAGQTWNEMEGEKSAAVAIGSGIAQATLDRLGLAGIAGTLKGKGGKAILNAGVEALVKKGVPRAAAQQQVAQASRRELAGFVGDAAKVAKQQIAAKQVGKDLIKRFGVAGGTEAATEALQEATGYLGATYGSDKEFNWAELNDRMIAGAIAGGALGGSFTLPSTAYDVGAWTDVAYRLQGADPSTASQSFRHAESERAQRGYLPTIQQNAAEAKSASLSAPSQVTLEDRARADKERRGKQSFGDEAWERVSNAQSLFQGSVANIFSGGIQAKSRSARVLADMFGGNLQRIYSGSNYESAKHHKVTQYKNMVDLPQNVYNVFSGGKKVRASEKAQISDRIYSTLNNAVTKDGKFDPNLIPDTDPHKQMIIKLGNDMNVLSNKMWTDQAKHNPKLGYIDNYLFKYKSINANAIVQDKKGFTDALKSEFKMSDAEAQEITDAITDNPEVNDLDEAFTVVRGGNKPQSHKKRSLGLSEKAAFQPFVERDVFANISNATRAAARYTSHQEFIGDNAGIVSKLLDKMEEEGVSRQEVDKVAAGLKNYFDAESGNYKRPSSESGKKAIKMQKNFMMFTALAGLPLATVSSFVEWALTNRALTIDQIFGKQGSLKKSGEEIASTLWQGANEVASLATKKEPQTNQTMGQQRLQDLGYYSWDVGAATTTGVTEVNKWQQHIFEEFFKWTGLQGWTNYTRAVRASISGDYITDKASTVADNLLSGEPKTREIQEAEESLLNLGIDPVQLANVQIKVNGSIPLTPEEEVFLETSMREGSYNFVNDAVALPGSANRPLIYQDPRFALFTQFQGFIATFTANHIPRLWGEYVSRGTPAMKYNAFAVMTMMIALGFASQWLKDRLKFGEDNPYLEGPEYVQRGIRSSGLLGSSERILDAFFPLYGDNRTNGPADWVFSNARDESPAISNLARLGRAGGKFLEGDVGEGVRNTAKATPIIGPFSSLNNWFGEQASAWNFKGDR